MSTSTIWLLFFAFSLLICAGFNHAYGPREYRVTYAYQMEDKSSGWGEMTIIFRSSQGMSKDWTECRKAILDKNVWDGKKPEKVVIINLIRL